MLQPFFISCRIIDRSRLQIQNIVRCLLTRRPDTKEKYMKRKFMWMTWGLISLIALLTIGYKSVASELEKQNEAQSRPVIIDPGLNP
jgi:hypothetical protein